jgi:hypothetical protein
MNHVITLSNGRKVMLQEEDSRLTVCQLDDDDTPWYLCQIGADGVLVYPNSGSGPEYLTEGLKKS